MKSKKFTKVLSIGAISLSILAPLIGEARWARKRAGQDTTYTSSTTSSATNSTTSSDSSRSKLDKVERSHLTFMREEEKLARDVYLTLSDMYPNQRVFNNIAKKSEQTHTDRMRDKLAQFNLPDPNPDTNALPDSIGFFLGEEWGDYFTKKYNALVDLGSESELAALYVGAFIEELDMHDIVECPEVMVAAGYPKPCGLQYTDERALRRSYSSLIRGSENHLRAFVGQIEAIEGYGTYKAQYLTQEEVDTILGR